jgi:hypothetical protein
MAEEIKTELTNKQKLKLKAKESAKKFRDEFKKSVATAMIAAFGFLTALVWKDVITGWVTKISEESPVKNSLITALITTIIAVMGILIVSKLNSENKKSNGSSVKVLQ